MANLNKVMLIGRLTRDPETRSFVSNGREGKVAKFGLGVKYMMDKKNPATGAWEGGESAFINIEVFNRENRQLADLVESRLRKGAQVYVEGRLRLNKWTDKDGQERQQLLVVADTLEFLEPRSDGFSGEGASRPRQSTQAAPPARKSSAPANNNARFEDESGPTDSASEEAPDDIPF
jgi:single-strand DNA-binding protein